MGAAVLALAAAGCGRSLPEEEPVASGPIETGAFEVEPPPPAEEGAAITGIGNGAARDYVLAAAEAYRAEDPAATIAVEDAEPDFAALCAGEIDLVATTGDAEADVCDGEDAAIGFHLANTGGEPIVVYVNRASMLEQFELEGLIEFTVNAGETLPQSVGAQPLSIDELQETQTKLEQVIAGVR